MTIYKKTSILTIIVITIFRIIYINFVPLVPQEAYYWKYAKNLALSYFDHPPMTAYIIAFLTWIGGDNVFSIRLGSIMLSTSLMILLYFISQMLLKNERITLYAIIAMNCTILFSIGATILTPDVPLLFCWTTIIFSLVKLQETNHWKWWYFAGMALGFGLLSKYTAILIVPGIFIFLVVAKSQRRWLRTCHPCLGFIFALIIFSPVIFWNYHHEWASFAFQSSNRFSQMSRLRLDYFFQLIGSQLALLTPYIFVLVLFGWYQIGTLSFKNQNEKYALLFWIAFPVYLVFILSSFRSLVKMNWLAPAYITSIIAGISWIDLSSTKWSIRLKKLLKPGLVFGLIIVLFMHLLPIFPILPSRKGDTWTGWQELADRVMIVKKDIGENTFIFGHEYKIPSEITFYTPNHEPTHSGEIIGEKGLQYNYWTKFDELIGKNAIFVTSDAQQYRNIDNIEKYFNFVAEDPPLTVMHRNRVFRIFYIYRCYGYKGPNL